MELHDARVTIVGLGLMGGSMALRLRGRCRTLVGVEVELRSIALARRAGLAVRSAEEGPGECDVLVLATPVRETLRLLEQYRQSPPAVELLIDIGSSKRQVVRSMELMPAQVPAIGGHPLCGKVLAGFEHAEERLYVGSRFVLTPTSRTTPAARALAEEVVAALGAAPFELEASVHDRLLGLTSHVPYLLAVALLGAAESEDPAIWEVAASGFRSGSRLAASDLRMMVDTLITNRDMTLRALTRVESEIGRLKRLLSRGSAEPLQAHLRPLRARRVELDLPREITGGA